MSPDRGQPSEDLPQSEDLPRSKANLFTAAAGRYLLSNLTLLDFAIWLGLVLSICAVYAQVISFDFIGSDENSYIIRNPSVRAGLTLASVKSAFTGVAANNWMPVTILSHTFDVQLFGLQSGMHHLVNVVFHALSAVLLFVLLHRATHARAASAFVAFVFALHPLHVESVAWISERKDVLSTLFWFLTLWNYVRYAERPGRGRYLLVVGSFALGLLSKPMLVTLPFTLLLFDIWPLRRMRWPKRFWEKLPLFALSACTSVLTYLVQRGTGAVQELPLKQRIGNALISSVVYLRQMFWPSRLAVWYPFPPAVPAWYAPVALALILGLSAMAILELRTRPFIAVGWFWYLGTLVPVIGLVQVGLQSHADRYTYIPMVGLSLILAWGAADVVERWPRLKPVIAAAAAASLGVCLAVAFTQTATWENEETLYRHAIQVTGNNWWAQNNLGAYLMTKSDRRGEAREHFEAALRIRPDYADAHNNLGACLAQAGQCRLAISEFETALRLNPRMAGASHNLARCLSDLRR